MSVPWPAPRMAPSVLEQRLLMLSGDVERNPGPLTSGEVSEGCGRPNCQCSGLIKTSSEPGMETDLPYLDIKDLTEQEEFAKRDRLTREHNEVVYAYQILLAKVLKGLNRSSHTPKTVGDYIEGLEAFYRSRNSEEKPVPIFGNFMERVRAATTIEEILIIICEHCSYFNHHAIVEMINSLAGNHSDYRRENVFLEKFNLYARRKVTEIPRLYSTPSVRDYCTMVMVLNRNLGDTSLHEIESIRLRVGIQLRLARNSLRLIYIERNGVKRMTLAFQLPSFLHSIVFPFKKEQKEALVKEKVVIVQCCDYTFSIEEFGSSTEEEVAAADSTSSTSNQGNQGEGSEAEPVPMVTAPPLLTLPPCGESDYELGVSEGDITQAQLYLAQPGFKGQNYVAYVQKPSEKALVATLIIREHVRKKRAENALPKIMVVTNTKPRAHELYAELEALLPKALIHLFTGTEENSMTTKLCLQQTTVIVCTAGKLHSEMQSDVVKISSINLLIMDDSHLALRQTPSEAVIMHYVVKEKNYNSERPTFIQIVGLTESLCDSFPALQVKPMVDHLLDICASVDAYGGICSVPESLRDPLPQSPTPPTNIDIKTFLYQDAKHDFVSVTSVEMGRLEQDNDLVCLHEKWTQEYKSFLKEKIKVLEAGGLVEEGEQPAESVSKVVSQKLGVLELLWLYSEALSACNERGCEEGLAVINRQEGNILNDQSLGRLRKELEHVTRRKDAVVETICEAVRQHVVGSNASGILFVDSAEEAHRLCTEISSAIFHVHPAVVTRKTAVQYSTNSCINLTKEGEDPVISEDQRNIIQSFTSGETRLLVIPVTIETEADILSLPSCNVLFRLKCLRQRCEMINMEYVLTSAHSTELKTCSELIKDVKESLLKDAIEQLPSEEAFPKAMNPRLDELMYSYTGRYRSFLYRLKRKKGSGPTVDMLQLRCKKCRVFVCHGTELFTFFNDGGQHYVIPKLDFRLRSITKPYRSKHKTIKRVSRLRQMFCGNCCAKWGTICLFPRKECELPVLKSKNFLFEMDRKFYRIKMWSDALFYVPPISACDSFTVYGEESSKVEE